MSKILHVALVRGHNSGWIIPTYITREAAQEWREDGIEVYEVENVVPWWVEEVGLARPWCFVQDVFHFKNPWRGS